MLLLQLLGSTDFPWADRIIFNSIPLLDVNFFNASNGSFFVQNNSETPVAKIVRNVYFTVLSICVAFLTIIVAIAATKMALTALASEKAKYKEAITKWLFSIVLIFLMHNLMSFIFFVNEGMVEVASGILIKTLNDYNSDNIKKALASKLDSDTIVENFISANDSIFVDNSEKEYLNSEENKEMAAVLLSNENFIKKCLKYSSGDDSTKERFLNLLKYYKDFYTGKIFYWSGNSVYNSMTNVKFAITLAKDEELLKNFKERWYNYKGKSKDEIRILYEKEEDYSTLKQWFTTTDQIYDFVQYHIALTEAADDLNKSFVYDSNTGKWIKKASASENKLDIIGNMAAVFKDNAYTYSTDEDGKVTGWRANKISVTGALLYAIFVAQSILYFFSYIKRFFYIVVLAIMAPVIVLFDFLGKAIG